MKKLIAIFAVLITISARAAETDWIDQCEQENWIVNPQIALCSTHAYNIGATTNLSGDDRDVMQRVVALKATIITQQMKKQYDYLNSTIKRLKTQLEKQTTLANLQASGVKSETELKGDSGGGKDRDVILDGAENCRLKSTSIGVLECLTSNLSLVRRAATGGNVGQAGRQLEKDIETAHGEGITIPGDCQGVSSGRESITKCVDTLTPEVRKALERKKSSSGGLSGLLFGNNG
jgi:hypothetical protein